MIYYLVPKRLRNFAMLVLNLVFYGWGEPVFLLVMAFSTLVNYAAGRLIALAGENQKKRRRLAAAAITVDIAMLVFFKYTAFFTDVVRSLPFFSFLPQLMLPLPLGISFYTFHVISYIIDITRGDAPVQKSLLKFSMYISLFPQMIAGPITRYKQMESQLSERAVSAEKLHEGIVLILVGLAKKVLIANEMGKLWDTLKAAGPSAGVVGAWVGAAAFSLQIYFDFGGYSDMARGLGKLFGFELPVNFQYPYSARSVTDFWRRWHMTLSIWFRDYVYIPLGGSRRSKAVTIRNLFIVWGLTGFWHGANWNFLLWGLYYAVLLTIEKMLLRPWLERCPAALAHIYAILSFLFGWMIFANEDFGMMGARLKLMLGFGQILPGAAALSSIISYLPLLIVGVVGCLPLAATLWAKLSPKLRAPAECAACVICMALCSASLISQSYNPFLYFRF